MDVDYGMVHRDVYLIDIVIYQVIAGLWVVSIVGNWCNFLTLFYIGIELISQHSFSHITLATNMCICIS